MSRILEAACDASGKVTVGGLEIEDAVILSLGTKASTGVLLLQDGVSYYVASNATDLKKLIEDVVAIVEKIITISTGVDAASNSPGGQTANIAQLTTLKTALNTSKDSLK